MSRIENLGNYNTARVMLQEKNGDLSALINEFKEIGALEALPKQVRTGILIGVPIGGYRRLCCHQSIKLHQEA